MGVSGYKYTFRLNASHSNVGSDSRVHSHTFEIALYMRPRDNAFAEYNKTEQVVRNYLDIFAGNNLNTVPPFDETPPKIENIGEVFFSHLSELLQKENFDLIKLDISENPQRIFSISRDEISAQKMRQLIRSADNLLLSKSEDSPEETASAPTLAPAVADPIGESKPFKPSDTPSKELSPSSNCIFFLQIAIMIIAGAVAMILVKSSGLYPLGLDIHGHLFRSNLMYTEILKGNFYPLYNELWYNGIQPFRYSAPLPYYCLAFLQMLTHGNVMNAYLLFIWLSFSVGGIGWLLFGRKLRRPWVGMFFAMIWFLLPDNTRVFFGEGNFPRMFIAMVLPYIFYCLWQFVCYRRKKMIFPLIALMPLVILGHLMIAAMVGVASAVFLLIYSFSQKRWIESIQALFAMLFTFAVSGIWVLPALIGGLTAMSSEANAELAVLMSQDLSITLNPLLRVNEENISFYVGLSLFIIAIIGLLLSNRKSTPGFLTLLLFSIGSASSIAFLIAKLPFGQYFWAIRFTPIIYVMFLISMFEWKTLKKKFLLIMCFLILLDTIPSLQLDRFDQKMNIPGTHNEISTSMDEYLLSGAKSSTRNRSSLMDLSLLGSMPSYAFGTLEPQTPYVFGWVWQGSVTATNIAYLNEALEMRNYLYMFDRNLELGADTVLVDKVQVKGDEAVNQMFAGARQVGYEFTDESEHAWLFSYPVDSTFGVITDYRCLAIGTTAALVPGILPDYHPGDKLVIDEYTFEELSKYEKIYLSGFFYNNRIVAEKLVREIAAAGVEVFIDMSRIPADPLTNRMTFLDVDAQPITFTYSYPNLVTRSGVVRAKPFPEEYNTWNTVYLNGLTEATGYAWFENSPRLDFIGNAGDKNITFIGFNLLFHAYVAEDADVKNIMNSVMELKENALPKRTIVPIDIEFSKNRITIRSEFDNVNTTLAYQDIFESDQPIRSMNNLLIVDSGTTEIKMSYPHLAEGVAVTLIGILAEIATIILIFRKSKKKPHTGLKI
ncbi:MAG: 6-pyruvoyl-tetrahydropterin synthase-related protein [Oscillospiraceae bacterium]|nr:6-pyruvoyl-tetrahydropterin synthase-related protein [Oscillospiraceae bacterium]